MPVSSLWKTVSAIAGTSAMNGAAKSEFSPRYDITARMPGSRREYRAPSGSRAEIDSPSRRVGGGSRSGAIAAITARKLSVLIANAHSKPPMSITIPASAGPMTRPRFHCAAPSATAPASSSRGTRSGMSDWYAGKPTAPAQPDASTISVTFHGGAASKAASIGEHGGEQRSAR